MRIPTKAFPAQLAIALLALASAIPAAAQDNTLTASPAPLVICAESGQSLSTVPIFVASSSGAVFFTATVSSDGNWLTISPSSGTATTTPHVMFYAGLANGLVTLPTGTYNGQIVLHANGAVVGKIDASLIVSRTACGSTGTGILTATPGALAFQLGPGETSAIQTFGLGNTFPTGLAATVDAVTITGQNWLSSIDIPVNPPSRTISPVVVSVSSVGLASGGTYTGYIEVSASNGVILDIPVTLSLTNSSGKIIPVAKPNPVSINLPFGSPTIRQDIQLTNPSSVPINILAASASYFGPVFFSISPTAELIPANSTVTLSATVNPAILTVGSNEGSITVVVRSGGNGELTLPFTVNYGTSAGNSTLSALPSQLSFSFQTGASLPQPQNLILASNIPTAFSVAATTSNGGNWLIVSPASGVTSSGGAPTNISVQVSPGGLASRTFSGQITITNTNTGAQQVIPVSLLISDLPILTFGNSGATFNFQTGTSVVPTQQTVAVTSSAGDLAFTTTVSPVSGGNFLIASPTSGTTPQTLTLSLDPSVIAQLAQHSYAANVIVTASGANNSATYPVSLNVTASSLLNPSQTSLNFNYQTGHAQPAAQLISIANPGVPLDYSLTTSTSNCNGFLSATSSSGATPGIIAVSVNTAGMPPGICNGTISVISAGAGNSPLSIPVTLNIGNSAALDVSPGAIQVTAQLGTNPAPQTIRLNSTDGTTPLSFTVATATDTSKGWLLASLAQGKTPNSLNVSFNTAALPAGTYTGRIVVGSPGPPNRTLTVPVTLSITSSATASITPSILAFSQSFQGPQPAAQMLQLTSTVPGIFFTASATTFNGGNWLTANNASGVTPGAVAITANGATLNPGTYSGLVTIAIRGAVNNPLNVLVTLIVDIPPSLSVSPAALTFIYPAGASTPPQALPVQVTSVGGAVPFTSTSLLQGSANFLTVTPSSGTTPSTLMVAPSPAALAALSPGQYSGTVTISSPSIPGGNQTLNVIINVALPAPANLAAVVNAASARTSPVAPGELITIYGSGFGPPDGVTFSLTGKGTVPTSLANITVTFDQTLAPLTFVNATQINAIVPYEIAGSAVSNVVVTRSGVPSAPLVVRVVDTAPAIFSQNQSGSGQGAILNENNTPNGPDNPASPGSVIQIFATGEGLSPGVLTGSVTPAQPPFPKPSANVSLTIGGRPAQVQFVGEAPGAIAGLLQVNAVIPSIIGSGPQPVVLTIGNNSNDSQQIVVAIR